jgi:hypothetical protein
MNSDRKRIEYLKAVFFEVCDDDFSIAALVFESLLTFTFPLVFFLALYT